MENLQNNNSANIDQIKQIKKIYFWRTAFFGLVILTAGIAIGGASMFIFDTHKLTVPPVGQEPGNIMPRLRRDLGLTQEQAAKIRPILEENMQKLQNIREDARVEIVNILMQMNKQISPILAENQKDVWQGELLRLQNSLVPERPGSGAGGGGGRGMRRGAEQPGPGGLGRRGRGQQQRMGMGMGRGRAFEPPPPTAPNSPLSNIIQNEISSGDLELNDVND